MIDKINKILSNYFCKIITTDRNRSVDLVDISKIDINKNQTLGSLEKNIRLILKCEIKIIGLIHQNIPSNKKLFELKEYQESIYNQTDLEKKLNALTELSITPLNYDEDWIIRSLSNIYLKILSKKEEKIFNNFLTNVHNNNPDLYLKIYNFFSKKFPHTVKWLKKL